MNAKIVRRSLVVWAMLAAPLALFGTSSVPLVKTDAGMVEGKEDGAVHAFAGDTLPLGVYKYTISSGDAGGRRARTLDPDVDVTQPPAF